MQGDSVTERLCIFGGSFDPVHQGHVHMARHARNFFCLDRVLFMPCALSPLKESRPQATDEQRCRMLSLALEGLPWASVDRTDLELPRPSWSWRVAERIREMHPQVELFWLMGGDQWEALEQWNRWEYLSELVTFIVCHRGGIPIPRYGVRAYFLEEHEPASSSEIRRLLGEGVDSIPYLNDRVKSYIRAQRLYRGCM